METAIFIASFVAFFALIAMIATGVEGMWGWFTVWVGVMVLSLSVIVPCSIILNEQNAVRIDQERTACYDRDLLWVHDKEVCVNDEGWIVNVR